VWGALTSSLDKSNHKAAIVMHTRISLLFRAACAAFALCLAGVASAGDLAADWLDREAIKTGWDAVANRAVFVGRAQISVGSGHPAYPEYRASAIESALADARQQAAEWLGSQISSNLDNNEKLVQWMDETLVDGLAKSRSGGYLASDEFRQVTKVAAAAAMTGFSPIQTFENASNGGGTIEIVAVYSRKFAAWASGRGEPAAPALPLDKWFKEIPVDQLCRTYGSRFIADESGAVHLVAFGHAVVAGSGELAEGACGEASESAKGRAALASAGVTQAAAFSSALQAIAVSGSQDKAFPSRFRSEREFERSVKDSVGLQGASVHCLQSRTVQDPMTSRSICVSACEIICQPATGGVPSTAPNAAAPVQRVGDCPAVPEDMRSAVRQVRADGTGPTLEAAVTSALKAAIEREGVKVDADSLLRKQYATAMSSVDDQVRRLVSASTDQGSTVRTSSSGFIHSFELLSKSEQGAVVTASICANIVRFDPRNPRFGLPPTVAVVSMLGRPGTVTVTGTSTQAGSFLRLVEGALEPLLAQSGKFILIDERTRPVLQKARADIASRAEQGQVGAIETMKLGRELSADFLLVIELDQASFSGEAGPLPQNVKAGDTATCKLSARLVNVSSNEVSWSPDPANELMTGRDILLLRDPRRKSDPAERALSPAEIATYRAAKKLGGSLETQLAKMQLGGAKPAASQN
jgi:hypothetical protein